MMIERHETETMLQVILDCVDYTRGACRVNEAVGAVLPKEILEQARKTIDPKPIENSPSRECWLCANGVIHQREHCGKHSPASHLQKKEMTFKSLMMMAQESPVLYAGLAYYMRGDLSLFQALFLVIKELIDRSEKLDRNLDEEYLQRIGRRWEKPSNR